MVVPFQHPRGSAESATLHTPFVPLLTFARTRIIFSVQLMMFCVRNPHCKLMTSHWATLDSIDLKRRECTFLDDARIHYRQ